MIISGVVNPDFGKSFPCECRKKSEDEKRRYYLLKFCGLPVTDKPKTFGEYTIPPGNEEMLASALSLISGKSVFLTYIGPVNTGKTHLAISICQEFMDAGIPAKFYSCDLFLKDLKATFDRDAEYKYQDIFERACTVPLLVLDDFYQGKRTEWMEQELESLVDARYLKKLPTVFTTNVPLSGMSDRIASRLQRESWCRVVILEAVK